MQTQQSNLRDVGSGGNIGHWHGCNGQWLLTVLAKDDDKTTGNGS
jgi:hypothetical protein